MESNSDIRNNSAEDTAEDFGEFLLEKVVWGLNSLEENGEEVDWLEKKGELKTRLFK